MYSGFVPFANAILMKKCYPISYLRKLGHRGVRDAAKVT